MKSDWKRNRTGWIAVAGLALFVIVIICAYEIGINIERQSQQPEIRGDYHQRYEFDTLIQYDGGAWRQRKELFTVLFMGVDRDQDSAGASRYRSGGQADFLRLMVIDGKNRTISQVEIDRDTMTPITVLGVLGNVSGTRNAQISLSHSFGDGKEQSCRLTVSAVSNLLCGAPIDYYIALDMDAISVLNDLVGGVEVTLADDFSHLDPEMTQGKTLTLRGEQAELFVRSRMSMSVGTNEARMKRQEEYLDKLAALMLRKIAEDETFAGSFYDQLTPYMVTDITRGRLISESVLCRDYERLETIHLNGEHKIGTDGFMEFHADQQSLEKQMMELFYQKVE